MLKPLGDSAIVIQLGDAIDSTLNQRVHALSALLQSIPAIVETVPASDGSNTVGLDAHVADRDPHDRRGSRR